MGTNARALCSSYLTADAVKDAPLRGPIERFEVIELDGKTKGVVYVAGCSKGLVLNVTNTDTLCSAFGDDMEGWIGKQIEVFRDRTLFKGKSVDCCRVKAVL